MNPCSVLLSPADAHIQATPGDRPRTVLGHRGRRLPAGERGGVSWASHAKSKRPDHRCQKGGTLAVCNRFPHEERRGGTEGEGGEGVVVYIQPSALTRPSIPLPPICLPACAVRHLALPVKPPLPQPRGVKPLPCTSTLSFKWHSSFVCT